MIDRLEKKIGKFAVKHLIIYVLAAYVVGYILYFTNSSLGWYSYIELIPSLVMKGQVWRLFTWVCTVPQGLSIFIIFMFLLYYFIGNSLEAYLGAFRYNLYIFAGWFFMTLGSMAIYWITKAVDGPLNGVSLSPSTYYINLASFLTFAVIYPDVKVYFFGILPLKIKVLAWIDAIYLALQIVSSLVGLFSSSDSYFMQVFSLIGYSYSESVSICFANIALILLSLLNFFLFYLSNRKLKKLSPKEKEIRNNFRKTMNNAQNTYNGGYYYSSTKQEDEAKQKQYRPDKSNVLVHICTECGRTSTEYPDLVFRYCSRCEGNHEYCQDHLFNHTHIK